MTHLCVEPLGDKQVRIGGIDSLVATCLYEMPGILENPEQVPGASSPADATDRLLPNPTSHDDEFNEEWARLVTPDLRHLFASAVEIFGRDLTGLQRESEESDLLEVSIPVEHVRAWMSALNQARLVLGALFDITEADMTVEQFEFETPKNQAVVKIHVLGYLLQLFVELASGGPE